MGKRGKSLYDYCTENIEFNYLLEEFSTNNNFDTKSISYSVNKKVLWVCKDCKWEYEMRTSDRIYKNCNCPYCSGHRVNINNCIMTTHPKVATLFEDRELTYVVSAFSNKRVNFRCSNCDYSIKNKIISTVTRQGLSCPVCSDGVPLSEKVVTNLMIYLNIDFFTQKTFNWSNNKRYDFYIPSLNMIIETNGRQHYESKCFEKLSNETLDEIQANDQYKYNLAIAYGIKPENYVVIDCRKSDFEFIKNSILYSRLAEIFDLSKVDWDSLNLKSSKSLIITVSELWNSGTKETKDIMKHVKLGRTSVVNYLKKAKNLGLCDYSSYKTRSKRVIQMDLEGNYIKTFTSSEEASRVLNIHATQIRQVCHGKGETAKGYRWKFE